MDDFNNLVIKASDIISKAENYQWRLAEVSNEVVEKYGYKCLSDFSKQIEQTGGIKRSPATLRMFAYVFKLATKLNIPKDLNFSICQLIVFSDNPQKYVEMANKGAGYFDIKNEIYQDKKA